MSRTDYSEWLTPARLAEEERAWGDPQRATWPHFVRAIQDVMLFGEMQNAPIASMIEFGCGTGWVPAGLPPNVEYIGVDANPFCLELAHLKKPRRRFVRADVRYALSNVLLQAIAPVDLVCAFSFLKHFGLHEWDDVVHVVLQHGRWAAFSVPIADADRDEGAEFPHVWVTMARVEAALARTKHAIVGMNPLPWGETMVTACQP